MTIARSQAREREEERSLSSLFLSLLRKTAEREEERRRGRTTNKKKKKSVREKSCRSCFRNSLLFFSQFHPLCFLDSFLSLSLLEGKVRERETRARPRVRSQRRKDHHGRNEKARIDCALSLCRRRSFVVVVVVVAIIFSLRFHCRFGRGHFASAGAKGRPSPRCRRWVVI
jgi:hypothetical protein